ncbi:hypothetical protein [Methylomonas sp. MgM2]
MSKIRVITFSQDEMDELEKEKQRRDQAGFAIREINNDDGSVTLILIPPNNSEAAGDDVDMGTRSVASPAPSTSSTSTGLAWGAKVSSTFRDKLRKIATDLSCNPDFLMAAMAFETGESFSPRIRNPLSGATGLIQFMPNTAVHLGTTTDMLATMTAESQLDFVAKYFEGKKGRLNSLEDVYMAILWPAAVGQSNDYVLFKLPSAAYKQNKGLDSNGDGMVTKAEASAKVQAKLDKGKRPNNIG